MVKPIVGNRQPPLGEGWGIFSWRNGEITPGVDTRTRPILPYGTITQSPAYAPHSLLEILKR
jgi:hypothetical protein